MTPFPWTRFLLKDLKALIYCIISGLGLVFTLVSIGPKASNPSLISLHDNALYFLVRCNLGECSSLVIPFLGHLLNLGKKMEQFWGLWLAANTGLGIAFFYQLTKGRILFKYVCLATGTPFVIVALTILNPSSLVTALPSTLSALLAITLRANKNNKWHYFVTVSGLFNLAMSLLLFSSLLIVLAISEEGKNMRIYMLQICKSTLVACAIISLYLLLIDYNFLDWSNTSFDVVTFSAIYIVTIVTMLIINAKKTTK